MMNYRSYSLNIPQLEGTTSSEDDFSDSKTIKSKNMFDELDIISLPLPPFIEQVPRLLLDVSNQISNISKCPIKY